MKVLCLNNYYRDELSRPDLAFIADVAPDFYERGFIARLKCLLVLRKRFDRIVFYRDHRLLTAYGLIISVIDTLVGGVKTAFSYMNFICRPCQREDVLRCPISTCCSNVVTR